MRRLYWDGAVADPSEITVRVYHQCAAGASGSALGPGPAVSYWWWEPSGLRVVGDARYGLPGDEAIVRQAILEELVAVDVAAAMQDARAEAPDL